MNAEQRTPNEYVLLQVNMQMRGIIQYNSEHAFRRRGEEFVKYERNRRYYIHVQSKIDMVKLLRVYGGCLGVERRRRTWLAAISPGQVPNNR
jgi:hypothetical protein